MAGMVASMLQEVCLQEQEVEEDSGDMRTMEDMDMVRMRWRISMLGWQP